MNLNEQLNRIKSMMGLSESELDESLGVPSGILETAENLYTDILNELEKFNGDLDDLENNPIKITKSMKIGDHEFDTINVNFDFTKIKGIETELAGMAHSAQAKNTDKFRSKVVSPTNEVELTVKFVATDDVTIKEIISNINKNKKEFIKSLSHELMHFYESVKMPTQSLVKRADYVAVSGRGFGDLKPLNEFLFNSYFIHSIENVVRPTEVASELKTQDVSKKDFLSFLMDNETYKNLKTVQNFTYEGLKESLYQYIPSIKKQMDEEDFDYEGMNDDDIIDTILKVFMINFLNWRGDEMYQRLISNPIEMLIGFKGDKDKFFRRYIKNVQKYGQDYESFFKNEEKRFHYVATKVIKKISKLYDMAKNK
jgi:hypothetical protein